MIIRARRIVAKSSESFSSSCSSSSLGEANERKAKYGIMDVCCFCISFVMFRLELRYDKHGQINIWSCNCFGWCYEDASLERDSAKR